MRHTVLTLSAHQYADEHDDGDDDGNSQSNSETDANTDFTTWITPAQLNCTLAASVILNEKSLTSLYEILSKLQRLSTIRVKTVAEFHHKSRLINKTSFC